MKLDSSNHCWQVPSWVSARSHTIGTSTTAILTNARSWTNAVLAGPSADVWCSLPSRFSLHTLRESLNGIDTSDPDSWNEVLGFVEELRSEGFLQNEHQDPPEPNSGTPLPQPNQGGIVAPSTVEAEYSERLVRQGILPAVFMELTYRCNQQCVHCFNPGAIHSSMQHSLRRTPELRTDEILALLATMAEMGVYMVTFSGGEPSLRPDLLDILREAKRLGFSFNLFTNGQLSDDLAKEIAALWPRTVGISLYSSVPEIHDATTGLIGSLHRSLRTVRTFVNAGIRVTVKCPLMQHTIYGYKALLELCNELNVLPQFDLHISAAVDGDCTPAIHQIQDEATLRFLLRDPSTALYVGFDVPDVGRQRRPIDDAVCGAGTHLISIAPNGDVYPCNSFPLPVGSVRDDNLTHIRADSPVLAAWNSVTLSDYNECGLHAYCAYCNHCPGMAMTAHGDPLAPHETCCKTARARMAISEALRSGANPETPKEFGRDTTVYLPTRPCVTYSRPDPRRISTDDFTRRIEAIHLQGNPIRTMLHAEEGSPAFEAILAESLPARSRFADLGR